MNLQVQINSSTMVKVPSGATLDLYYTPQPKPSSEISASSAYVYGVGETAAAKSRLAEPDAPLTHVEWEQLMSAYYELGPENPLWEDIQTLLVKELSGNDRTNFLTVLANAESNINDFVDQVVNLEGEERSLYLSTALRNGSGGNLEHFVEAVSNLSGSRLTGFLSTADQLGKTPESVKSRELQHFVTAVAQNALALEGLIEKITTLDEENRELFLSAAANAGDELLRFIKAVDGVDGLDKRVFLETAAMAGKGMSHLLTLSLDLTGKIRSDFLHFTAGMAKENVSLFLQATQGNAAAVDMLTDTTRSLAANDRTSFLALAAGAGNSLGRLISVTNSLSGDTDLRSDFFNASIKAESRFNGVLEIAEKTGGQERAAVLSFAADLGFTDLGNFISAAGNDTSQAAELALTANTLGGKDKSYLLYAAALNPEHISGLTAMTQYLEGQEQSDFLFTAANVVPLGPKDQGQPDPMNELLQTTKILSGSQRSDFLARQRQETSAKGEELAQTYVYLNSVFDSDMMDAVLSTGDKVDEVMERFDSMTADQRQTFLHVAGKADNKMVADLMSVAARLDTARSLDFMDVASSLGRESLSDLILAASQALGSASNGFDTYDRLIATVKSLDQAVDSDFLNAAASSGEHMDDLMDLTNQLKGFVKTEFLMIADAMADRGSDVLGEYLDTTAHLLNKDRENTQPGAGREVRPSQVIGDGFFQGRHGLEGYFKSTLFVDRVGVSNDHMHDWFNAWRGIPRQSQ